jgi:hypothetical protein
VSDTYRVYAKPIQNNPSNEPVFVGRYDGYNKESAIHKAMNDSANKGIYRLDSFFCFIDVWKFEPVKE